MGRRVTLKDVAEAANVTTATVSYVLNDTPGQRITPQTRQRVLEAAQRLRYTPNNAARALKSRLTGCVGVVIKKNLAVPRFSQTLQGIQSVLEREGVSILLCTNAQQPNGMSNYVNAFLERRVDGIVYLGKDNQGPDKRSREVIAADRVPFVAFDCLEEADAYSTVDFDYRAGARLVTERVIATRPKRVVYLRPRMDTLQERLREQGVREAFEHVAGIGLDVREVSITADNLELWDQRYAQGSTQENECLVRRVLDEMRGAVAGLAPGDGVVSSWSGWSALARLGCEDAGLTFAELANNGERQVGARWYTRLPNYEAGCACAEEILSLIDRKPPTARTLKLTNIQEERW